MYGHVSGGTRPGELPSHSDAFYLCASWYAVQSATNIISLTALAVPSFHVDTAASLDETRDRPSNSAVIPAFSQF